MNKYFGLTTILLTVVGGFVKAQNFDHTNDHVLNDKGSARVTMATGIPYVAIGEYAYGFTGRITVGVLAGLTPNVEGYGIRGRAVLYEQYDGFRVYFCTPILYYPKTKALGGDPWWLTRPNINFEWMTGGFRYKVGGSLIAASSHHSLFGNPARAKFRPGFWNAVHGGFSLPIGPAMTFECEASLVMNGLRVAGSDWVGGPPVILVFAFSHIL